MCTYFNSLVGEIAKATRFIPPSKVQCKTDPCSESCAAWAEFNGRNIPKQSTSNCPPRPCPVKPFRHSGIHSSGTLFFILLNFRARLRKNWWCLDVFSPCTRHTNWAEAEFVAKAQFSCSSAGTGGSTEVTGPVLWKYPAPSLALFIEINQKFHRVWRARKGKIIVFTRKQIGASKRTETVSKGKKQSMEPKPQAKHSALTNRLRSQWQGLKTASSATEGRQWATLNGNPRDFSFLILSAEHTS